MAQTKPQIKSKYKYSVGTIGIASAYVISSNGLLVTAYHNLIDSNGKLKTNLKIKFPEIPGKPEFQFDFVGGEFNPPSKRNKVRVDLALLKIKESQKWTEAMKLITPFDIHFRTMSRNEYIHFYFTKENESTIAVRGREIARSVSSSSFLSEDTVIGGASGSPLVNLFGRVVGTCYHGESQQGSFYNSNSRLFDLLRKVQIPEKINKLFIKIINGQIDDAKLLSYMDMHPESGRHSNKLSDLDLYFLARKISESSKNFEKGYEYIGCSLLETLVSKGFGIKKLSKIFPKRFASLVARDLYRKTYEVPRSQRETFLLASKSFYEKAFEYNTSLGFKQFDAELSSEFGSGNSSFYENLKYPNLADNPKYVEEVSTLMIDYGKVLNDLSYINEKSYSENNRLLYLLKGVELTNNEIKQSKTLESIGDILAREGNLNIAAELYSEAWVRGNQSDLLAKNYAFIAAKGDISKPLGAISEPSSIDSVIQSVIKAFRIRF
ncbi:hypothetical protein [Allomuricauda sp. R78024]|uniref:hypothetical protein n=1 Tax=Allomuricauda sp. R78024 TaxID=3093867 RepID=UPI0037CA073B